MSATDKYHDVALACTQHLFDSLCRLLCSDSGEDLFAGMYSRVKAALEFFDPAVRRRAGTPDARQ